MAFSASSAESVGTFRLRQPAKCVKQRDFDAFCRSEAVRFSDGQFCLAVETLDNARRNLSLRMESVRQEASVMLQALGDLLHLLKTALLGLLAP